MRAAGITALGEPVEIFEVDELATPAVGEVLIDVVAAGIGNWDDLVRIGSWQIGGPAPMALGTEAAGTVAAVGSGVVELREGDEVMTHPLPLRRHGTWAGRVLAPAATVAARPPEASWEAGAAFPIPALTAAQALDEALGIESGGWVVVNGAGGVTGGLLVQLAAARGARVIATASAKKAERIRGYGAFGGARLSTATGLRSSARSPAAARPGPSTLPSGRRPPRCRRSLTAAAPPTITGDRAAGRNGASPYRRLRPARWSAAPGPRGAAGPRHRLACRSRPSVRSIRRHSAARGSRGSGRRDRPVTPSLAWPADGRAQAAQLRGSPTARPFAGRSGTCGTLAQPISQPPGPPAVRSFGAPRR